MSIVRRIEIEDVDLASATRMSSELKESILDREPKAEIEQERSNPQHMDAGSILTVILGGPAVITIAAGIADWLRKREGSTIQIKDENGEIVASGLSSKDAVKVIQDALEAR